jgi:signal transduction histidine kinase
MKATDIDLRQALSFMPEHGILKLGAQRNLIFSQDAFAKLRRLMFDQLGVELARSMLTRFGYQNGVGDYRTLNQIFNFSSEDECLRAGPMMHSWSGIVLVEPTLMEMDRSSGHFHFKGRWKNSYEAEIHLKEFGLSPDPVCHTLTGYGSGWCSEFFGTPLLEIETKCVACGDLFCEWEIRPYRDWGDEAKGYVQAMRGDQISISRELEDRRREVEKLNASLELKIQNGAKENARLLRVLCHDLKAPIAILKHAVNKAGANEIQTVMSTVKQAVASVEEIIRHLNLDSDPDNRGSNIFRPLETRLLHCIQSSANMFKLQLAEKKLRLIIDDQTVGSNVVLTDPVIFTNNIMTNLLHNAIKFCPAGGEIKCTIMSHPNGLSVQVSDSGIGIPKQFVENFNAGKEIPGRRGLLGEESGGTGLSHVRGFVGQIGAKIEIESKSVIDRPEDHGTTVSIFFPNELLCKYEMQK